jgi:hypothetical protein
MMLAEPKGFKAQLFRPLGQGQNFLVIALIRPCQFRVVIAKNKDTELHCSLPERPSLLPYGGENIHLDSGSERIRRIHKNSCGVLGSLVPITGFKRHGYLAISKIVQVDHFTGAPLQR